MPIEILTALISAAVSVLTVVLSEVFLRMRSQKAEEKTIRETYRKYADPLAISSAELFWRLHEAFDTKGSGFYLRGNTHLTRYEHYKALSTLYRIASLLAWIRALRRELFFLPRINPKEVGKLDLALQRLTSALAEGGHVESLRVTSLIKLWGVGADASPDAISRAGIQVDRRLKDFLHENGVARAEDLPDDDKLKLSHVVAKAMTEALGCSPVAVGVLLETRNRTMVYLSIREAWVYRDWQAAIGDVMLRQAPSSARLFEVIGYKDFETLCKEGEEHDRAWMRRLNAVIDDLDTHGDCTQDARIEQLRAVYMAAAEMIRTLHSADPKRSVISPATLAEANAVLNIPEDPAT